MADLTARRSLTVLDLTKEEPEAGASGFSSLGEKVGVERCPNPYFTAHWAAPLAERAWRMPATLLGATVAKCPKLIGVI